jgi:hypothetical protein
MSCLLIRLCGGATAVMLLGGAQAFAHETSEFTFCYDASPPYAYGKEGAVASRGLKVELAERFFKQIPEVKIKVLIQPWARCQLNAKIGTVDGILPLPVNSEHEQFLVYSRSVGSEQFSFWYNKKTLPNGIHWDKFSDIAAMKLGMIQGAHIDDEMERAFTSKGSITRLADPQALFKLLQLGRIDILAIDGRVGRQIADENRFTDLAEAEKVIGVQEVAFGFSKKSKIVQLLPRLNLIIENSGRSTEKVVPVTNTP